jgi:hypothetical protein
MLPNPKVKCWSYGPNGGDAKNKPATAGVQNGVNRKRRESALMMTAEGERWSGEPKTREGRNAIQ